MTFGGPCLDDFTGGVPAGLHHALVDTGAEGGFLDDLALRESDVELGGHHVAIGAHVLADVLILFLCLNLKCHNFEKRLPNTSRGF